MSLNFLSIGQIYELGIGVLFTNHGVNKQDPQTSQVFGMGRKVGRTFEVHDLKIPQQVNSIATITTIL